eukprot:m.1143650 g.1143650  ORF g.1143650 m.1143650 type:complete len:68 (+) comp24459_c0_seq3:583-786(+)
MQRLCAAVADNCVLRTLDLSCNDIDGVDATCTEYLASALVSNSSIRALLRNQTIREVEESSAGPTRA